MSENNFPRYRQRINQLTRKMSKELPGPSSAFERLREESLADGALSRKAKELISLGIAIAVRCGACVALHVDDALRAGATRDEVLETIGVATMMGGGPAATYGCHAYEALEQFETERAEEAAEKLLRQEEDC
jgi:AhpD family alkylhydroperoxidase